MSEISDRDEQIIGEMVDAFMFERDQQFDRLLREVEASRSTETRDQLKEKLNKLYDEVNKLFYQVRVVFRELAISAEDPAEARHYADLVLRADAGGLISEEEEHAESAVIGHIRWREGRDVGRSYNGDFLRPTPTLLSKDEIYSTFSRINMDQLDAADRADQAELVRRLGGTTNK
jgi:hypothetical protein